MLLFVHSGDKMGLIREVIDENTVKITNTGDVTVVVYEFRGTKYERPVILRAGESATLQLKYEGDVGSAGKKGRKSKKR